MSTARTGGTDVVTEVDRLLPRAAWLVAAGYLASLVVSVPLWPSQNVAGWFDPAALLAIVSGPVAALVFGRLGNIRALRWSLMACVWGFLLSGVLWFIAWDTVPIDDLRVTWLFLFAGLPGFAYVLVRPLSEAIVLVVASVLLVVVISSVGSVEGFQRMLLAYAMWPLIYTTVFMLLAKRVMRTADLFDAERAEAVDVVVAAATSAARSRERARFDALVHDRVIATLIAVTPGPGSRVLASQAASAVAELERLAHADDTARTHGATLGQDISGENALAALRMEIAEVREDVEVITDIDHDACTPLAYPGEAVVALGQAAAEAVRNAVRHAGTHAQIAVLVELSANTVRLTVADDGVGFDEQAVPPDRLGIAVSIRRRMAAVPGGFSRLRSDVAAAGAEGGTTVQVGWVRP